MRGISVVLPVFNEIDSVDTTIQSLLRVLGKINEPYEIIIVNDGSTDGTANFLKNASLPATVKILTNKKNLGYGASLKIGIKKTEYEYLFIVDCDGTYPLDKIDEMVRPLFNDECDMVVGARMGKDVRIPLIRRPAKWLLKCLADYLTGEKIPDLNSGFRGIRKEAVQKFFYLLPDGFSFTTTITLAMITNHYRVEYVTISYQKRIGKSKIRPFRDTANFIQLIIRTVLYFDPLKVFLPISGCLFVLGFGVFLYSYFVTKKVLEDTTVIILMAAFQIFAIGLMADLINKRMR